MFSFLHRLNVSLKTSLYCQEIILCCLILCFFFFFLLSNNGIAVDMYFMNHRGPWFQLKIFFTVLLKKMSAESPEGKLTASFHFWVLKCWNLFEMAWPCDLEIGLDRKILVLIWIKLSVYGCCSKYFVRLVYLWPPPPKKKIWILLIPAKGWISGTKM